MPKNKYPCKQDELYDVAETAWNLFLLHIGDFSVFRKRYSVSFYGEKMNDIKKARMIKERVVLQDEQKSLSKEMIAAKKDVLYNAKCLLQYIKPALGDEENRTYNSWLSKLFPKASNNNWAACNHIGLHCINILERHNDKLCENDNMPVEFAGECTRVCKTFEKAHREFLLFEHTMMATAVLKVHSNNLVYEDLTGMLKNAQLVYRNRPDMQVLFRFDKLLKSSRRAKKTKTTAEKPKAFSFLQRVAGMF